MAPSNIPPVSTAPPLPSGTGAQVVQIVSLPDGLQNNARAIRVEGEVIGQNDDGSVRVRTPQGDIDINVRGRQPQEGQRIEVDIPVGNPPRNATIRPAPPVPHQPLPPANTAPPAETPLPLPSTRPLPATPPAQGQAPAAPVPEDGTAQPLPPAAGQTPKPAPEKTGLPAQGAETAPSRQTLPALPPLAPGAAVKLVAQAAVSESIPQTIATAQTQAAMAGQKAQGTLISTLLQAVKAVLPDALAVQSSGNTAQTIKAPMMSGAPQAATTTTQPLVLDAKIVSLTLPSGQTLTAPMPTPAPVAAAPAMPQPHITPSLLTVTIAEVTPQNQPVVPVPLDAKGTIQNFILQSPPATVPVGTQITLQPQIAPSAPVLTGDASLMPVSAATGAIMPQTISALPPAWRAMLPLMQAAPIWPAMDDLFQTFYQATPQAAQVLGRTIPSPSNGANFGPAIMLFAAALKSGDLQGWMGEKKLEMIQKLGKDSVLSRLSGETSSLAANNDAAGTDWKSYPIPLLWQNEISKVMFHVRKEPSENEQEQGQGGTRFVMDLSLTRMGDVQLDGLVRDNRLDLIVRTQIPISAMMQEAMATAYATALDGTKIYGEIGFQSDRTNWETILKTEKMIQSV